MSLYSARIVWTRLDEEPFIDNKYSRSHHWSFDGGLNIPASSSPQIVSLPLSVAENIDPEEAFVASLSSCHMLFFLSIAAKLNYVVDEYVDNVAGVMGKNKARKLAMIKVTLRPFVTFSGKNQPSYPDIQQMHHQAHERCFIANSVTSEVMIEIASTQGAEGCDSMNTSGD